jgi:hypothetical protein
MTIWFRQAKCNHPPELVAEGIFRFGIEKVIQSALCEGFKYLKEELK